MEKRIFIATTISCITLAAFVFSRVHVARYAPAYEEHTVVRVIDGDTFVVLENNVQEKVRMLGIDTPETVDPRKPVQCFGPEASAELKKNLAPGTHVRLERDSLNEDRDKYHRLLRYVYTDDGALINAAMIRDGFAFAYTKFSFQKRVEFLMLQNQAHVALRGLWSPATCNGIHK